MHTRNSKLITNKFFEFFIPTILMTASMSLSIIIDSIIVGNVLGSSELAAMNLIMPVSLCISTISGFLGIGGSNLISAFKGKMDNKSADKVFTTIIVGWLFLSIIGVIMGIFFTNSLSSFFASDKSLQTLVYDYLKVYIIGTPFSFAILIFPFIIKSDGNPKLCSIILVISNVINLFMDIIYMKYMNMGLAGGALATITGYAIGLLICIIYLKSPLRTLHFTKIKFEDFKYYIDMFKYSISSMLGQGFMFAKLWILNMIISSIAGKSGLVSFSVCMSCLSFISMFIAGAAQTMMPLAASFYASDDTTALKNTVKKSFLVIIISCISVTLLFEIMPTAILNIYNVTSPDEVLLGITAIRIFSLSFIGIGFSFFIMYYMQTIKRAIFSLSICALEGFIFIVPICFIMSKIFGINGIWLSYIINELLIFLFICIRSKLIVKKSQGKLHSLFLFKYDNCKKYEVTIDLSNEKEITEIKCQIYAFLKNNSTSFKLNEMEATFTSILDMMKCTKSLKENSNILDMTIKFIDDTFIIEIINSGTPINMVQKLTNIEISKYINEIKKHCLSYNESILLGMNYIKISYNR